MSESSPLTLAETLEIAEELLSGWRDNQPPGEFSLRRGVKMGQFVSVFGLAAHAHRLGSASVILYQADLALEAQPTVRCAYEHALTAMWTAQYPNAAQALVNESYRNRKNAIGSVKSAGWAGAEELVLQSEHWGPIKSPLDEVARHTEQMCNGLEPAGESAYAIFRLMSMMSHPGAHLIDYYIYDDPIGVQATPKEFDGSEFWMFITCCALVWAGRAVDMLHKLHPRRNELRAVAKELGILPELRRTSR